MPCVHQGALQPHPSSPVAWAAWAHGQLSPDANRQPGVRPLRKNSIWKSSLKEPGCSLLCFAQQLQLSSGSYPWCLARLCCRSASAQSCTLLIVTQQADLPYLGFNCTLSLWNCLVNHGLWLTLTTIQGLVGWSFWCCHLPGDLVTLGCGLLSTTEHSALGSFLTYFLVSPVRYHLVRSLWVDKQIYIYCSNVPPFPSQLLCMYKTCKSAAGQAGILILYQTLAFFPL